MSDNDRIDRIAEKIVKTAFKDNQANSFTLDQLLEFLYSQVNSIELTIEFSNGRTASKKKDIKKEIEEAGELEIEWEILKSKVEGLPSNNNGQPFYKGFFERVLENMSIPLVLKGRTDFDDNDMDPDSR